MVRAGGSRTTAGRSSVTGKPSAASCLTAVPMPVGIRVGLDALQRTLSLVLG
ncbi:hypothetical protein [Streptomyces sp. NBC_01275]|uniref:hypothetical protein n=1 Tax=Streptomyces sp. NBC_01275 TaxID=2903807 RepID=UPI002254CC43|nr:hypothetical protein [Streptomyces sp. NBC_01275]